MVFWDKLFVNSHHEKYFHLQTGSQSRMDSHQSPWNSNPPISGILYCLQMVFVCKQFLELMTRIAPFVNGMHHLQMVYLKMTFVNGMHHLQMVQNNSNQLQMVFLDKLNQNGACHLQTVCICKWCVTYSYHMQHIGCGNWNVHCPQMCNCAFGCILSHLGIVQSELWGRTKVKE